jgi:[glutamine synthetase] adenylyltransferase / [glutamine synthetase]-adenylyl-L-tyrosine phosphorylase
MQKRVPLPEHWPDPADPAAAARLAERIAPLDPRGTLPPGLLRAIGGNSPYLSDLAVREAETVRAVLARGPDPVVTDALARLDGLAPRTARARLTAELRAAKRVVALAVAVADLGGLWPLEKVTAALSDLAEATLRLSVAHLLFAGHEAGHIVLPYPNDPARGSGFVVLGMGKLGARELNYSSDVDLILLHDPDAGLCDPDEAGGFFTRLARGLVTLMEARDADGYVFRVDLRLRPDPAATPPSIQLPAAIGYYESMGQNWERAAMLKARPVAGDLEAGASFLAAIRPFVWRRHLDFAAIADIHAMKRRIDAHKGTAARKRGADALAALAGFDVKLGQGGIREIEFLVQTLQLLWGGRDPALRVPATLEALRLLVRARHLTRRTAADLAEAYHFLRQVEHRAQMIDDRQTHKLPESPTALVGFTRFMGYAEPRRFAADLNGHLERVRRAYRAVFEAVPEPPEGLAVALDFSGNGEAPPHTEATLREMGYANPDAVVAAVRGWLAGRLRALRSQRARELLTQMLPTLLAVVARQREPDAAFARLDQFLASLPAGVQPLSMFQRNPALFERVAAVLGAAPLLADHLARFPAAAEGLITPQRPWDIARGLRAARDDAATLEDAIGAIRRGVRETEFAVSVATLEGRLDADAAGLLRAELVDATIKTLLPPVLDDFAARYGRVRGGGLAVVVLGKAGGREMMAGSDLDLMLIYDHPANVMESAGAGRTGVRPLPASQWFIRAVHAFIAALTAPDAAGPLYAVDMRLRPSGNKGPVAVSLSAFTGYHAAGTGSAWTWERMALTRARVVAGPPVLRRRVAAAIADAVAGAGPAERVRADAAAMRARIDRDLPAQGPWDVKHRPGGGVEVEFIAQTLQLLHTPTHPEVAAPSTREALARLRTTGLLESGDATLLIGADRMWRTVQGMLRLTEGPAPRAALAPASVEAMLRAVAPLCGGTPPIDEAALLATLDALAVRVRAAFQRLVGPIGGATEK